MTSILFAQRVLSKKDFIIDRIAIDGSIDSAFAQLGPPLSMDSVDNEEVDGFHGFHFEGVIIWAELLTSRISSFVVSTPKLATSRGLRVGDSVRKLEKLYGKQDSGERLPDDHDKRFGDYTTYKAYEYDQSDGNVFWAIFNINGSKIISMYFYRGLGC